VGTKYQRGYGVIQNIGKFLLPIAKNIANMGVGEAMSAGSNVLRDVAEGKNLPESALEHVKTGISNIGRKMQQCGKRRGRKTKAITNQRRRRIIDSLSQF
jgi:hypothetical protein